MGLIVSVPDHCLSFYFGCVWLLDGLSLDIVWRTNKGGYPS